MPKPTLKSIIEDSSTPYGRAFAFSVQGLIILSLITFSLDTLPNLSGQTKYILWNIEVITVTLFTLEYLTRILVADNKLRFVFSCYGMIDLVAFLPFYIASGLDLRAIRIVRLLRIIRILKLFRYSRAIRRYHRALILIKEELILFGFVALILIYLAAIGIYYCENQAQPEKFQSVFHGLWWAVTTLTTVGYGDVYPITLGGRLFTFFILMIGLGTVAVPTGLLSSALAEARSEEKADQ
ncbi:MAG: voltage-gated potassium channel [Blastopirellula sp.]|nr:MAG: voltage-gated potassium channel [Blastopirellula sp.]